MKAGTATVVTANRLRTGTVVYLRGDGRWSERLDEAAAADDAEALRQLESLALAAVERAEVTSVYAFDVRITDGSPEPLSVREQIRAARRLAA